MSSFVRVIPMIHLINRCRDNIKCKKNTAAVKSLAVIAYIFGVKSYTKCYEYNGSIKTCTGYTKSQIQKSFPL